MQSGSSGVHHRHVGGGTTLTSTTTNATRRTNNKTRLLRKKSSTTFRKNELIVAVVATALLTCVAVLISVKVYVSLIGGTAASSSTTTATSPREHNHYKPHDINPPADEYDAGDDGGRPQQQQQRRRHGRGRPREEEEEYDERQREEYDEYDDRRRGGRRGDRRGPPPRHDEYEDDRDERFPPRGGRGGGGRGGPRHEEGPADDWDEEDDTDVLPWNEKYQIPDSIETVGDRSDEYVLLRKEIDAKLPFDSHRSLQFVQNHESSLYAGLTPQTQEIAHSDQVPYDIYDCPDTPPTGYPFQWKIPDILDNWGPDDVKPPTSNKVYQGLCVFDYNKDYDKAVMYRDAELPFVVINDPQVAATVERWQNTEYLENMLGPNVKHRCEYSENNHFMYYTPQGNKNKRKTKRGQQRRVRENVPEGWKEPTKMMRMTFTEWLEHAKTERTGPDDPHWYFRLIGCGGMGNDGSCDAGSSEYLFDELPFFQPKDSGTLYVVEPEEQKGIHCRFGMKGVIAENHFDSSRNAIVVLGGSRRYILSHPDQCEKLALYPKGHPSARHSAVDWSQPDYEEYPEFATAVANEVVLQAGQVLYLPTDWFHYIVSLEFNYQCNTRSGITNDFTEHIRRCGF